MNSTHNNVPLVDKDSIAEETIERLLIANSELRHIMEATFWRTDGAKKIAEDFEELQPRMMCLADLLDSLTNKLAACYNIAPDYYLTELKTLLEKQ